MRNSMKQVVLVCIGVMVLSSQAKASHWGEINEAGLQLLNNLFVCPKVEQQDLLQTLSHPYTKVTKASFVGGMMPTGTSTTYNYEIVQWLPAPSFVKTAWNLEITVKKVPFSDIYVPDAPSFKMNIKCSLKKVDLED